MPANDPRALPSIPAWTQAFQQRHSKMGIRHASPRSPSRRSGGYAHRKDATNDRLFQSDANQIFFERDFARLSLSVIFQWDAKIDASSFTSVIPDSYELMYYVIATQLRELEAK